MTKSLAQELISTNSRRWWGLSALAISLLVIGLDMTIVVTALPTLSEKLGAGTSQLQWVMNAYTLALAGLMLPAGVLGDRLGRKRLLMLGLIIFGASSLVASQANNAGWLIAARALQGIGGAAVIPLAFSMLPTLFAESERPRAVSVLAATVLLGLPMGPLIAGWLLNNYSWGSIFLINVPVVAAAMAGVWRWLPESKAVRPKRLDWIGAALSISGVTALVYGIIEQPMNGWGNVKVLGGLIGGAVLLLLFSLWQLRTRTPLIDLKIFTRPRFSYATLAFTVIGFALGGVLFILTPFLQIVQGNDAQSTGLRLLPMILGIMAGALPSDRLSARAGTKWVVAGGLAVSAIGSLLLSRVGADGVFSQIALAEAVIGLGIGLAMPPAVDAILGELPAAETGAGMALTRTFQTVALSLGVAILGSILSASYRSGLNGHLNALPPQAQAAAEQNIAAAAKIPHAFSAGRDAYARGMSEVMKVSAGVVAAAAVPVALFLPHRATSKETVSKDSKRMPAYTR